MTLSRSSMTHAQLLRRASVLAHSCSGIESVAVHIEFVLRCIATMESTIGAMPRNVLMVAGMTFVPSVDLRNAAADVTDLGFNGDGRFDPLFQAAADRAIDALLRAADMLQR